MTLIVDEVMLREPNLLVPRKKPVGPVKIDWSLPITNGLKTCAIATSVGAIDIVSGQIATNNTSGITKEIEAGKGIVLENAASTDYSTFTDKNMCPQGTGGYTIIADIRKNGTNNDITYICGQRVTGGTKSWAITAGGNERLRFRDHNGSAFVANYLIVGKSGSIDDWVNDVFFTIGIKFSGTGGDDISFYHDGILSDTYTTANGSNFDNSLSFLGSYTGSGSCLSDVNYVYIWQDRELTDAEHASIAADPYQFLIPA